MQTTNIGNTNFKGLYKIPNTQNNMQLITRYVIPPYQFMKKHPAILLEGMPQDNALKASLQTIADACHGSIEWLYLNAKNFGINIPVTENSIYVFTDKTLEDFAVAIAKTGMIENSGSKLKFKNILNIFKKKTKKKDDLPEHILQVKNLLNEHSNINRMFDDFYKENKIISKSTPQELFSAMMRE